MQKTDSQTLAFSAARNKPHVLFRVIKLMDKLMLPHSNEPLWLIRGSACKVQSVQTGAYRTNLN